MNGRSDGLSGSVRVLLLTSMATAAYRGGCACWLALSALWLAVLLPFPTLGQPSAAAPSSAQAQSEFQLRLSAAARLYEDLDYERALEQLTRAKAVAPGVDEEVIVGLYEGIILADMGRREEALSAFKAALYLRPAAKLPVRVSPKVAADFEEVRQEVLRSRHPEARPAPPKLAPPKLAPPQDAPVRPPEKPKPVVQVAPPAPSPAVQPVRLEQRARPVPVLPLTLLGAGVVAGGIGTYFGLQSGNQVQAARDAEAHDARVQHLGDARNQARVANILFGVAGAVAAGAVITFFTRADEPVPAGEAP
jgi:tetratricopeptide (TPR) repeat protein